MSNSTLQAKNRNANRFLTFYLDNEIYGIDISDVKEIIALMKTTPVPKTPKFIQGVMNLRGNIIPVINMRLKFDMPDKEPEMYTAIVSVQVHDTSLGFIVDKVEEVVSIDEAHMTEAPKFGTNVDTRFIRSMARMGENVIMVLQLSELFAEELSFAETITTEMLPTPEQGE